MFPPPTASAEDLERLAADGSERLSQSDQLRLAAALIDHKHLRTAQKILLRVAGSIGSALVTSPRPRFG